MNFRFFKHRLMNEAESEDAGASPLEAETATSDAAQVDSYSSENLSALAEQAISEGEGSNGSLEAMAKEQAGEKETIEKNTSLIDELMGSAAKNDGQAEESEGGDIEESSEWLENINKLGLVDGENTIEVQSEEHLKELIQKGHNYTQKTQGLSEERKAWETERIEKDAAFDEERQEFNTQRDTMQADLQENQMFQMVLNQMKANDPDMFEEFAGMYQQVETQFNNPIYQSQMEKMNQQITELKSTRQQEKASVAQKEFDLEYQGTDALLGQLKDSLGLEVDKNVILNRWANGDDVKKAIFAEYGDRILKLQDSKKKLETTRQNATRKTITGAGKARNSKSAPKKLDYAKSYSSLANELASMLGD